MLGKKFLPIDAFGHDEETDGEGVLNTGVFHPRYSSINSELD